MDLGKKLVKHHGALRTAVDLNEQSNYDSQEKRKTAQQSSRKTYGGILRSVDLNEQSNYDSQEKRKTAQQSSRKTYGGILISLPAIFDSPSEYFAGFSAKINRLSDPFK